MIEKGGIASALTTVGEKQKDKKSSKVQKKDKRLIEPELKKSRRFNMVLTEDEYINLLQNAQHSKTVTHYVIESCLSDTSRPYKMTLGLIEGIEKMTKELNAIGTNINQTTKHINFLMKHDLLSEDVFKRQQNDLLRYTNALIKVEDRLSKLIK
jgi:Bacterial mobilisation protein (MobC)